MDTAEKPELEEREAEEKKEEEEPEEVEALTAEEPATDKRLDLLIEMVAKLAEQVQERVPEPEKAPIEEAGRSEEPAVDIAAEVERALEAREQRQRELGDWMKGFAENEELRDIAPLSGVAGYLRSKGIDEEEIVDLLRYVTEKILAGTKKPKRSLEAVPQPSPPGGETDVAGDMEKFWGSVFA